MSQQKGGSFVRDKLAGDVLVSPHSCYRYVRGRELLLLFERILVISREKLFRLTSITLGTLHLRATSLSLSRATTFQTRRRERRRKEGGKKSDVLCCSCFAPKFGQKHRFDAFQTIRTRVTRPHCGGKGRKRGKFTFFASF